MNPYFTLNFPFFLHSTLNGYEKGTIKTIRENIRDVLEERFGIVKESILDAIYEIKSVPFLQTLLRQSVRVKNLEEFRELIAQR